jgi:hypothetical protein
MRTLSRPMFNMGGPIKQGIMNGIREPHAGGGRAAALVGNPVYPQTGGREHHGWSIPLSIAYQGIKSVGTAAARRAAQEAATKAALSQGVKTGLKTASGTGINAAKQGFWRSAWEGDPIVRSVKWLNKTLRSPTAKGWAEKAAKTVVSPTGALTGLYVGSSFWPDGTPKDDGPPTGLNKAGGFPSAAVKEKATMSQAQKDAFAMAQRTKRVQKYLDMMGYDASKKTAIADALIDASKIVSDRGTLDLKNITGELINPVIQATSKRLDKPGQIREAVGLMATKAEIEKDLSKETDALKTRLTELQIEGAENALKQSASFEGGLSKFISDRKGKVDKDTLERISRLLADQHNELFVKTEEGTVPSGDGIYMIGDGIYRVTGGVEKQIA